MDNEYYPQEYNSREYTAPQTDEMPVYAAGPDTGAPPPPPVMADVAPRAQRRGPVRGLLIVAALVVVLALVAGFLVFFTKAPQQAGALVAANNFCAAEKQQNYTTAYSYFTAGLQTQVPQDAYVAVSQGSDTMQGKITACSASSVTVAKDGKSAVVHGSLTRQQGAAQKVDLSFTQVGNAWKLGQSPDPALLPLATGYEFCNDIKLQQFDAAYQLLSSTFQQGVGGSADQFKQYFGNIAQVTGPLKNCTVHSFALGTDKQSATIGSNIDFNTIQGAPTTFYLSTDTTGAWKIDKLSILVLGTTTITLPIGA